MFICCYYVTHPPADMGNAPSVARGGYGGDVRGSYGGGSGGGGRGFDSRDVRGSGGSYSRYAAPSSAGGGGRYDDDSGGYSGSSRQYGTGGGDRYNDSRNIGGRGGGDDYRQASSRPIPRYDDRNYNPNNRPKPVSHLDYLPAVASVQRVVDPRELARSVDSRFDYDDR